MKLLTAIVAPTLIIGFAAAAVCGQNYKIKQSTSISGQNFSSTVYVKGSRKRTESSGMMGMAGMTDIEQCDLKRTIKVSDSKKLYFVEPFQTDLGSSSPSSATPSPSGVATKGGTITITNSITDTGERKQMFGLTARRIKSVMTMQSSPDACNKSDMQIEIDGWYVDLPQFSCPVSAPRNPYAGSDGNRGCTDRMVIKNTGTGKLGFPLSLTQKMKMGSADDEDMPAMTQTIETVEFSKAPLDDAMFDIPVGYMAARSANDLYEMPGSAAMSADGFGNDNGRPNNNGTPGSLETRPGGWSKIPGADSTASSAKKPGMIRVGVIEIRNSGDAVVSVSNLQAFLAKRLTSGKIEGVVYGSEAEARAAGCDYVLSSNFTKLKQSTAGKVGSIFGKITNTGSSGNFEAQLEFQLQPLTSGQRGFSNKIIQKNHPDASTAAEAALSDEANSVLNSLKL